MEMAVLSGRFIFFIVYIFFGAAVSGFLPSRKLGGRFLSEFIIDYLDPSRRILI